jgi:plastocyanin
MHPTGVASAAWVFASAPSKVPFYVAGGLLAGWAVLLGVIGLSRPEFPGSAWRARIVMGISAVLVAATATAAVVTAGTETETETEAAAAGALQLAADPGGKLVFDRKTASAKAGRVTIRLVNRSPVPHNVTIAKGSRVLAKTKTIQRATASVAANLAPGDYVFFCSVDEHRQAGMQGKLTVR